MTAASTPGMPGRLAGIAMTLLDSGALEAVNQALGSGALTLSSTSVCHSAIAAGSGLIQAVLRDLQGIWRQSPQLSGKELALALASAAEAIRAERERAARAEVVWTGPRAETSYLRATRQVVLELVRAARCELLVVGYWITSDVNRAGIVPQIVQEIASAARRGASINVVLDRAPRPGGGGNREQLLALWPREMEPPALLTWQTSGEDSHLKLHAKVIVSDRRDALVTSANLTLHAMDLNMEMGVRILGAPAGAIADHFDRLIASGVLVSYGRTE